MVDTKVDTNRDEHFMARALFLAERGRGRTSPNPLVGALVVGPSGIIAGQGAHLEAGGPHAEVVALDAAHGHTRGSTVYVSLEPCCHRGRTGPCVERVVSDGVARVVFAVRDPNPLVAGGGARYLGLHGVRVTEGVLEEAALAQNAPFFTWITAKRPFVILKAAASTDGFVGVPGRRVRLTSEEADRFFHRQRAEIDAIAVGSGTILADDPTLTARHAYRVRPLVRVIFDWRMRVKPSAKVFSTLDHGPIIMIVSTHAAETQPATMIELERRGISIERRTDRDLTTVLRWLAARGIVTLLVEGGPTLQQAFATAGLVDHVQVVISPTRLERGVPLPAGIVQDGRWRRLEPRRLGPDRLVEWDVHGTH